MTLCRCLPVFAILVTAAHVAAAPLAQSAPPRAPFQRDLVKIDLTRSLNTFQPEDALGGALDGHEAGENDRIYTQRNIASMKSAGLGAVSYRLRTELAIEAWRWNPEGQWSNPIRNDGYWISNPIMSGSHDVSYGYRLPRRGDSIDQANNDGYSRVDDGDTTTFWKSNPYLDTYYTGDNNDRHPQWVCIDFKKPTEVDAVRIEWGKPYATDFSIEGWTGVRAQSGDGAPSAGDQGAWKRLCAVSLSSSDQPPSECMFPPIKLRYLRLVMRQSSGKPEGAADPRNLVGYAIREIYAGHSDRSGKFVDRIVHAPAGAGQTAIMTSSTDSWHTPRDRDEQIEQPSFDRVFKSGLTRGLPLMVPVAVAYDTPENAAAELQYFRANNLPVSQMELGEEPDGQLLSPEDYGALFIQFAHALKAVDPSIQLGGPSFQTDVAGWRYWPNASRDSNWMRRFLSYLDAHGHRGDFSFFTFEWYPFDNLMQPPAVQLLAQPHMLHTALAYAQPPRDIPWYMTEYGYSAFAGEPEVTMAGALMDADIALSFLAAGGRRAYLYGYEPAPLINESAAGSTYGNLSLFLADDKGQATQPFAAYYAVRMMTRNWLQAGDQPHRMLPANVAGADGRPTRWVCAYAVARPDNRLGLVLLNKDPRQTHLVRLAANGQPIAAGPVEIYQYSSREYVWRAAQAHGFADPDRPPAHATLSRVPAEGLALPPFSMTVVRLPLPSASLQLPH